MATGNASFTTFLTSTLEHYRPKLIENLMGQEALFWQLKQRGMIEEQAGSRSIVQPLMYGANDTVASYSGYDLLDVTPQLGITASEYAWKFIAGSVTISGEEEFKNSGDKTRVFNLLEAKIRQLELSMQLELNAQLFAVGTANGGKDITGLLAAIPVDPTTGTYAGIDRSVAANAWWRTNTKVFTGTDFNTTAANTAATVEGLIEMRSMFLNCSVQNEKPSLIITTQDLYEEYEANLEGQKLQTTNTKMADAGFMNQQFKGVPMIFDEDIQDATMLFLNADYMKFVIGKGRNFVNTPFVKPENQDAKVSNVLFAGNLVMSKADVHGRISSFVARA